MPSTGRIRSHTGQQEGILMKKIDAIIRPHKLDEVKECLSDAGVQGIMVSEVKRLAALKSTAHYRGAEFTIDLCPMIKLEIVVPDAQVASVVRNIEKAARTGRAGDGRIFVTPVYDAIRIRTGEHGSSTVEVSTAAHGRELAQAAGSSARHVAAAAVVKSHALSSAPAPR
jgi:nitrogen regulatory protein P-II 1